MSVGRTITKQEIDARLGDWAVSVQNELQTVATLKSLMDGMTPEALVALGYTDNEAAVAKTAVADGAQRAAITTGQAALAQEKDFRVFISQLWGVGSF